MFHYVVRPVAFPDRRVGSRDERGYSFKYAGLKMSSMMDCCIFHHLRSVFFSFTFCC